MSSSQAVSAPFTELLRRSRFASFDPYIRQTYGAPQNFAQRGNFGLKRPIDLQRKNAFITFKRFEDRADYNAWNHAEQQVRFVRRFEELGVRPNVAPASRWMRYISGKSDLYWLVDSEFCPGQGMLHQLPSYETKPISMAELTRMGGQRRQSVPWYEVSSIYPNADAMSPRQFRRYLKKLRALRPEFKQYLAKLCKEDESMRDRPPAVQMSHIAQTERNVHEQFLSAQTAKEFQAPGSMMICEQPHRFGGLVYDHRSTLETLLCSEAKPGLILQENPELPPGTRRAPPIDQQRTVAAAHKDKSIVTSFAGMTPSVEPELVYKHKKKKLLTIAAAERVRNNADIMVGSNSLIDRDHLEESIALMRIVPESVILDRVPRPVGRRPEALRAVKIHSRVGIVEKVKNDMPGSESYILGQANLISLLATRTPNGKQKRPRPNPQAQFATQQSVRVAERKKADTNRELAQEALSNLIGSHEVPDHDL